VTDSAHRARPGADGIAVPPKLPLAVRALNRAAGGLRRAGLPLARLDEGRLVAEASRAAGGADDFGEGPFLEPLRRLLGSLEEEAELTFLGRSIARRTLVRVIRNRLQLVADRKRHPEIAEVEIRRPLVVVGLPRTGSTILHDLLACDPASRAPLTWECDAPSPPPERATRDSDPRIAASDAEIAGVDRLIPGFRAMHPMGARMSQECVVLNMHAMATPIFHNAYRVPGFEDWVDDACDWAPVYAFHRRQLQHLQWRCPGERWVLKSGGHMWALDRLLETYPDACIVATHRDPVKVAASFASLATLVRSMASDAVDPREVAADWTPRLAKVLDRATAVRDSGRFAPERFYDMAFRDLLKDPMGVVERIYDHFGFALSGAAADAMRAFIARNPQGKHGIHRYHPAEYGLDPEREWERFGHYVERFGIEPEAAGEQAGALRDL
jgi:transposase